MSLSYVYKLIGPAGVALAVVGCVALYLSIKYALYLHFVWRDFKRNFLTIEMTRGDTRALEDDNDNPLVSIVRDIVKTHSGHSEDIRAEVAYLFQRNFGHVKAGLTYLRLISMVSPLLGLLGTILGMVTVFSTISATVAPDAAILAKGIWEALVTTIMGLCVAIPTLFIYYYLLLKFKGFHVEAVEYSYRALELCSQADRAETAREKDARHAVMLRNSEDSSRAPAAGFGVEAAHV